MTEILNAVPSGRKNVDDTRAIVNNQGSPMMKLDIINAVLP